MPPRTELDHELLEAARALAVLQDGVVSRRQLYALGVPRWLVTREVRQRRWVRVGDQAVCVHTGPLSPVGHRWAALFVGGPRAMIDGASALVAAGMERFDEVRVRVSVPRGARIRHRQEYDVRQTRRWSADDRHDGPGIPRTRTPVAALRAALWARTDREATYVVTAVVQQGLASPEELGAELLRIRRDQRRPMLHEVVNELLDGARSLGELDVARALKERGLPAPQRQVLRRDGRGRYYLDLYWPQFRLVVEVDGIHHAWVENIAADALRQNALVMQGDRVLRLPLLGFRLERGAFLDQIEAAMVAGGLRRAA